MSAVVRQDWNQLQNRPFGSVDNFVAAKAPDFRGIQHPSTEWLQRLQQQSTRINKDQ
jgi:hypothetical protein